MTYQWQHSKDEGKTWTDISGETSETLTVTIQSSDFGSQYRCIAKDFMGHVATSQAGKLASSIVGQSAWDPEYTIINEPDDYYGRPGDIATFIVEAEGENLSYQWLYQAPGTDELVYCTSSDATTNTIRVEMTAESDGAQYCCFITDANGDMGSTRTATVRLDVRDWTMEYEAGGLRTKRSSAEKTYNYIYNGNQLVRMTVGDDILDFTYDANGAPLTLLHNGTVYYYITNLQGDVISLETMDGMQGAHYYYDAWGKILASAGELAELNPLRYRGYVYDQETGFYYLQSRYYDPTVGRWINVDSILSTEYGLLGYDLFAYCNNDPVNNIDQSGQSPFSVLNLADYRRIHKMVQAFCMAEYNWDMEVYVKSSGSRGFLDLYDYRKNEYYEVKSDKIKRDRIVPQMKRYDKSVIAASRYKDANIIGHPKRGTTDVAGSFPYGLYDITYWTKEDGLIVYHWDLNGNRTMACAVALVTIFCVAMGNIPGAIGAGTAGTGFVGAGALLTGLG